MSNITRDLLRKRAEHNEGMISTMEELTLHQEELMTIDECLGQSCRQLKILLLQNNIINKMEVRLRETAKAGAKRQQHIVQQQITNTFCSSLSSPSPLALWP